MKNLLFVVSSTSERFDAYKKFGFVNRPCKQVKHEKKVALSRVMTIDRWSESVINNQQVTQRLSLGAAERSEGTTAQQLRSLTAICYVFSISAHIVFKSSS